MADNSDSAAGYIGRVGAWVGVAGSVLTMVLTVWNVQTKNRIDAAEERQKTRETELHERAQQLEETKEQVARYAWVRSLFSDLKSKDAQDRTMSLALIRLALKPEEAKALFGGLAQSSDRSLQEAGQKGLANLESEASNDLIFRINGEQAADRLAALSKLTTIYKGSPATISAVLRLFDDERFAQLTNPGVINAFYYLAHSDPGVWTSEQVALAFAAIAKVKKRSPTAQTQAKIIALESMMQQIKPAFTK